MFRRPRALARGASFILLRGDNALVVLAKTSHNVVDTTRPSGSDGRASRFLSSPSVVITDQNTPLLLAALYRPLIDPA